MQFVRAAREGKPAITFTVDVTYSLHCFSYSPEGDDYDRTMVYPATEFRVFDSYRYELSKRLPGIIEGLDTRVVRQTGRSNFITVEVIREDGGIVEYDVFFKVKKPGKGRLELRVESAYVRDANYGSSRPAGKRIGFLVILHNTLNNLAIRS
jgi:hypothetical protein